MAAAYQTAASSIALLWRMANGENSETSSAWRICSIKSGGGVNSAAAKS